MTNNQWSPAAVEIGDGARLPAAVRNAFLAGAAGVISCGARLPIASKPGDLCSDLLRELPGVPALFRTRLQLELLLQEPVVDLRAVTDVILADPGATIELFRLAGREWMPGEERAERVEDALAGLLLADCMQVVSGADGGGRLAAPADAWDHARLIALRMRQAAEAEDLPHPEQAYLVGLLHELGTLPALLGPIAAVSLSAAGATARGSRRRSRLQAPGSLVAEEWRLPWFLVSALRDIEEDSARSPWARLVADAHQPNRDQEARTARTEMARPPKHAHSSAISPKRSRVLSFTSERVVWKRGSAARPRVQAPMRPPA